MIQNISENPINKRAAFYGDLSAAYDRAGRGYAANADGEMGQPFSFRGRHCFADHEIWRRLDAKLMQLASDGRRTLRVLDAGCGPGTWLRRIVLAARELGFTSIEAHGIDLSARMVELARQSAPDVGETDARIAFAVCDLADSLPFGEDSFDITLCLYGVLNHMLDGARQRLAAELARVTLDTAFVTVRTVGSLPTIYVDALDHARSYHQDNESDWMDIQLADGGQLAFPSHLFTADELRALFRPHLAATNLVGLDVFHSRFAADPNWNPAIFDGQDIFDEDLEQLEKRYASDPIFINRAAHILLVGEHHRAS